MLTLSLQQALTTHSKPATASQQANKQPATTETSASNQQQPAATTKQQSNNSNKPATFVQHKTPKGLDPKTENVDHRQVNKNVDHWWVQKRRLRYLTGILAAAILAVHC
eukprot:4202392-Amphidinium_carterae.4